MTRIFGGILPYEAVEAFKRAWHEADAAGLKGSRVERGMEAAAPLIAAKALRDAAGSPIPRGALARETRTWLRARADRIEGGQP